ncbi:MAG: hypothetical protein AB1782_00680 [Cyanobacteriota bacterium]
MKDKKNGFRQNFKSEDDLLGKRAIKAHKKQFVKNKAFDEDNFESYDDLFDYVNPEFNDNYDYDNLNENEFDEEYDNDMDDNADSNY